jgi:hypothetical protein
LCGTQIASSVGDTRNHGYTLPQQFQEESNRHATAEVIDKAGVLFPEEGLRAGKSCRQRKNFPFLANGWRSDIDVIAVGGLRLRLIRAKLRSFWPVGWVERLQNSRGGLMGIASFHPSDESDGL